MANINSAEYWESRFKSGNWSKGGCTQTEEYAKANVSVINLSQEFNGTILDFGCALGDAIPIYSKAFPYAKIVGVDISESAIKKCRERYGLTYEFYVSDYKHLRPADVIIASHLMEHLTDDKLVINELISKCNDLFVFVPYRENPLYFEHVHSYDESSYTDLNVLDHQVFSVVYRKKNSWKTIIKEGFKTFKIGRYKSYSRQVIMFHFKGKGI
jgi:2-polyprenyl-3-methyl-5-hydroxy-6-metoxy-1,4-benzoquinol methylase